MRTLLRLASIAYAVGLPLAAAQDAPQNSGSKPAWAWSDEERFAARFAPGAAKARLYGSADKRVALSGPSAPEPVFRDVVFGKTDPHLFFPVEVFREFVNSYIGVPEKDLSAREQNVVSNIPERANAALPPNWKILLERDTAEYRSLTQQSRKEIADLAARLPHGGPPEAAHEAVGQIRGAQQRQGVVLCPAIHKALAKVRADMDPAGLQSFLAFLYSDIAPRMAFISDSDDPKALSLRRQYLLGGCQ
jgi:hypothetical protein